MKWPNKESKEKAICIIALFLIIGSIMAWLIYTGAVYMEIPAPPK